MATSLLPETTVQVQSSAQAYLASEKCFLAQETLKCRMFVSSWNVGGVSPPDTLKLEELLNNQNNEADIYVFGFQEVVPLNAGNVLGPENKNTSAKWNSLIKECLNKRKVVIEDRPEKAEGAEYQRIYPLNKCDSTTLNFECIISKQMVGIFITIWARKELHNYISFLSASCVGCGILGHLGNKGSVSVRFCLHETSFCFVCSHLASGTKEGDNRRRNTDAAQILESTLFPTKPQHLKKILDHDRVIWLGDLNYKIYLPEATTRSLVKNRLWSTLLEHDQLKAEMAKDHIFQGWNEKEIEFAPTYKYNQDSDTYYGSNHKIKTKRSKAPAWCDRIIWYGEGLKPIQYDRGESSLSDHRPVRAIFLAYMEISGPAKVPGSILSNGSSSINK